MFGVFVLGILFGWLAEWLYYTYFVKAGINDGDCSALKTELDLKNRQIGSLQSQLAAVSDSDKKKVSPKSKVAAVKKAAPKKASIAKTTKKAVAKKVAPAKVKKSAKGDDLTKVEGIGPKAASAFKDAGINSYADLAKASVPALQKILDESDGRFGAMNPGSWPKQAKMAADGKWDELKKWQDAHDGGLE